MAKLDKIDKIKRGLLQSAAVFLFLLAIAAASHAAEKPEKLYCEGIPNLFRITPNLYRSAQFTRKGIPSLEKLEIKTVVSFRHFYSDKEMLKDTPFHLINIPMNAWDGSAKLEPNVINALRLLSDESQGPFLVHCQHGADRTGLVVAMYRIVFQGWTKEDAIAEMVDGGFGYHSIWSNLIQFIKKADIEKIKKEVGSIS